MPDEARATSQPIATPVKWAGGGGGGSRAAVSSVHCLLASRARLFPLLPGLFPLLPPRTGPRGLPSAGRGSK